MAYLPPGRRKRPQGARPPGTPHTPRLHPVAMIGLIVLILVAVPAIGYAVFLAAALLTNARWN